MCPEFIFALTRKWRTKKDYAVLQSFPSSNSFDAFLQISLFFGKNRKIKNQLKNNAYLKLVIWQKVYSEN